MYARLYHILKFIEEYEVILHVQLTDVELKSFFNCIQVLNHLLILFLLSAIQNDF